MSSRRVATLLALALFSFPATAAGLSVQVGTGDDGAPRLTAVVDDAPDLAAVTAELRSRTGRETLALVESDAWLEGAATLGGLPAGEASVTVVLYDAASAPLLTLTGTLDATGAVRFDDAPADAPDIAPLGAFASAGSDGTVDLSLLLSGADVPGVAYAQVTTTETRTVTTCAKGGACTEVTEVRTESAELGWSALGSVWMASPTLDHAGALDVTVTAEGVDGRALERTESTLGAPFADGGGGAATLLLDKDAGTTVSVFRFGTWDEPMEVPLVVIVTNESKADAVGLTLDDGSSYLLPVTSYQRPSDPEPLGVVNPDRIDHFRVTVDGGTLTVDDASTLSLDVLSTPRCAEGVCVTFEADASGSLALSATTYGTSAAAAATTVEIGVATLGDDGTFGEVTYIYPHFQDDVRPLITRAVDVPGSGVGAAFSGTLEVDGPGASGKAKRLTTGSFAGVLAYDADGDIAIAGASADAARPQVAIGAAVDDAGPVIVLAKDGKKDDKKISKEEAEAIKAQLVEAGATVEIK